MILEIAFLTLVQTETEQKKGPAVQIQRLNELDEYEIAVEGSIELPAASESSQFSACIPQESKAFEGKIPASMEESMFDKRSMEDLMDCDADNCAFNFLRPELNSLRLLKTPEERKNFYLQAFKNRADFKIGTDPSRSSKFIRSKDNAFQLCGESKPLNELLNGRPLRDLPFRLSHVKYSKNMRPTTRLLQGTFWTPKSGQFCYAEALVFSDHYDIDLVTLWSLEGNTLKLQFRNRIDLLNSWLRRLNKEKFRKEAETIVESQLRDALNCFQTKSEKKSKKK